MSARRTQIKYTTMPTVNRQFITVKQRRRYKFTQTKTPTLRVASSAAGTGRAAEMVDPHTPINYP